MFVFCCASWSAPAKFTASAFARCESIYHREFPLRSDSCMHLAPKKRQPGPLACFVLLLAVNSASAQARPSAIALPLSSSITLDGKLDEPAWASAKSFMLTQQAPQPGQPTPYKTEVRVLVSK